LGAIIDSRVFRQNRATHLPGAGMRMCRWVCTPPPDAPRQGLNSISSLRILLRFKAPVVQISARGSRCRCVIWFVFAATRTGTATNVAVHRVLYAPIRSTESRSLTRARSQPCVSRSALSPGGTPKDIRANTDTHCWLRPRLERHKGALDLKIVAPARAVRSYKRGTSESDDKEMISASNTLIHLCYCLFASVRGILSF
jgi:hypothetical protein